MNEQKRFDSECSEPCHSALSVLQALRAKSFGFERASSWFLVLWAKMSLLIIVSGLSTCRCIHTSFINLLSFKHALISFISFCCFLRSSTLFLSSFCCFFNSYWHISQCWFSECLYLILSLMSTSQLLTTSEFVFKFRAVQMLLL